MMGAPGLQAKIDEIRASRPEIQARQSVREKETTSISDLAQTRYEMEEEARSVQLAAHARAADKYEGELWQARANRLQGFPPRAVADLMRLGSSIEVEPDYLAIRQATERGALSALIGTFGTGKTTMAGALAQWYMTTYRQFARYVKASDLIDSLRAHCAGFSAPSTPLDWTIRQTRDAGFLVVDELDKFSALQGSNDTSRQNWAWFEALIDRRYAEMNRPTLLIGNFTDEEWKQMVPGALRDRARLGGLVLARCGESFRKYAP